MKFTETELKGCYIIEPKVFEDKRGYFFESFNKNKFSEAIGVDINFIQDNQSKSTFGVLRGLHFQKGDFAQAKLVRVLEGEILDVAVDLRKESETFGKHITEVLSSENNRQLFIPRGFAHGFVVLSKTAVVNYKVDNLYSPENEGGIIFNDQDLKIDWNLPEENLIISDKDIILPGIKDFID